MNIKDIIKRVISIEAVEISGLSERLTSDVEGAVKAIQASTGKVIVSGLGKSGIIAKKISGTFTSTGTPTTDLPGYTTWTVSATSDSGSINGIDITFAGAMNQVNPFGLATTFSNNNGAISGTGGHVSQDSQFLFHSGDILPIGAEEGPELLKAAITNISAHTDGAMSVDFA